MAQIQQSWPNQQKAEQKEEQEGASFTVNCGSLSTNELANQVAFVFFNMSQQTCNGTLSSSNAINLP